MIHRLRDCIPDARARTREEIRGAFTRSLGGRARGRRRLLDHRNGDRHDCRSQRCSSVGGQEFRPSPAKRAPPTFYARRRLDEKETARAIRSSAGIGDGA